MRNIFISNVIATGIDQMSGIQIGPALPEQPIEGVRLENIRLDIQGRRHQGGRRAPAAGTGHRLSRTRPARHACPPTAFLPGTSRDLELANISVGFEQRFAPGDGLRGRGRSGD